MAAKKIIVLLIMLIAMYMTTATVYIKEDFEDGENWEDRWIESQWKKKESGKGMI